MLIDTHAHLDYSEFSSDLDQVVLRARQKGVGKILTIGTGLESSRRAVDLAGRYDEVFAVVGVHPTSVSENVSNFRDLLRDISIHEKVVAIGETGLDYHRLSERVLSHRRGGDESESYTGDSVEELVERDRAAQASAFKIQLELALERGLNVVIHQREAWEETLKVLEEFDGRVKGVFHCFGGSPEQAFEVIERGHLVSFTGIVTFKNAENVRKTVATIPEGCFMVETDCPYLAPVPFRGNRCEPWHTVLVAEAVALSRQSDFARISRETTFAAENFFHLGR